MDKKCAWQSVLAGPNMTSTLSKGASGRNRGWDAAIAIAVLAAGDPLAAAIAVLAAGDPLASAAAA